MVVGLGATLEGLCLSANAVTSVDEDLGTQLGALATLDLNSNELTAIPDGVLQDVGEHHRLDLSHNRIAAVTMETVATGPQKSSRASSCTTTRSPRSTSPPLPCLAGRRGT